METLKKIARDRAELNRLLSEGMPLDFDILDDHEIISALKLAAAQKQALLNRKAYLEELSKPLSYPSFDYDQLKSKFLHDYKTRFNREYELDKFSEAILDQCLFYFSSDGRFKGNPGKGLYLVGNPGCGKSSMMRILAHNTRQPYIFVSCIEIARNFSKTDTTNKNEGGYNAIEKYIRPFPVSKQVYYGFDQAGWCFDDLGFEEKGRHFGRETEVMTEIIEGVYNRKNMIGQVHVTSNIDGNDVEARYGNRIRSRMREMFNILRFDKNAPDRRR